MSFRKLKEFNNLLFEEGMPKLMQMITGEEPSFNKNETPTSLILPLLPIKDLVLFPGLIVPISLTKKKVIKSIQKHYKEGEEIGVLTQKRNTANPGPKDLYLTGTKARILKVVTFPDGNTTVILQGKQRFHIKEIFYKESDLYAEVSTSPEPAINHRKKEVKALMESIREAAIKLLHFSPDAPQEMEELLREIRSLSFLTYFLAANINAETKYKQSLLDIDDPTNRATSLLKQLLKEVEINELKYKIQKKVHTDINQQQRDYYLRQQIKVLYDELGESAGDEVLHDELASLKEKSTKKKWPKEVAEHFDKILHKASRLNPYNSDYSVLVNHAEALLELPWKVYTKDNFDLKNAAKTLDKNHYGLDKVKERILEYLAVKTLKKDVKGPILCFVGPPGVGKTSLGKSIAEALGREYVKISLGGLQDEAEIRGHRKTYVGAMSGKIMKEISKAGSSNPVFLLDEIDKIDHNFRGDPSAALLEVLDPEQNTTFTDNFLEVPFDLSKVLFIATANTLETIDTPLRDRMETIEVSSYPIEEKVRIAKKYLVPKQKKANGLKAKDCTITDKALMKIIEGYTYESGVRELERKIGSVIRKVAKSIVLEELHPEKITEEHLFKLLGPEPYDIERYQKQPSAGVAVGLAWTPVGGDILFIETALAKGKGKLTLSGQLGEVMQESAMTALSYLRAHAALWKIDAHIFDQYDLHIHIPDGAVPKDGPSAGITLLTALVSLYTQRKLKDHFAMSGEITLRGIVLPVGGIKEKILAAKRAGIKEIVLSKRNQKDVEEIKKDYIKSIKFHYVEKVEEVLKLALEPKPIPNAKEWPLEDEHKED